MPTTSVTITVEEHHNYGEPTWTWNDDFTASAVFTCTDDDGHTQTVPATVTDEVTTEPTCDKEGLRTYTAKVTFEGKDYIDTKTETLPATSHDTELVGAKDATCTEDGYTGDEVCKVCGVTVKQGEVIPALGHDYKDGKCGRCGETEQRETTAETCPSEAYTDLDRNGWYHEYVDWALKNGVMNGVGGGLFEPNGETTRAMLVMVLYRMAGTPDMAGRESSFTDVSADSWYGAAVIWASENGIVNGVGGGLFDPDASLTREQMAMMLYRFAGYLGSNTEKRADLSAYGDADAVSAFAQDAMAWAVAEGLVNGRSAAELAPKAGATRAELATILFRFAALQNA